jgi:hypothetical protein
MRLTLARPIVAAALLVAVAAGCSRNRPETLLAPTGVRPAPAPWKGSVTGLVYFDPLNTPDMAGPPYPPTTVQLFDTALVATQALAPGTRWFTFRGVKPGIYSVVARSRAFFAGSIGGIKVREDSTDAGNLTLRFNPVSISNTMDIGGTIPGYSTDQIPFGPGTMDQNVIGIWTYPNSLYDPLVIPAGTYAFKFYAPTVTWGGASAETLTVPVSAHAALDGAAPRSDIVVRFPSTGVYTFTLDERRQTFSVSVAPPGPGRLDRRSR